MTQSTQPPAWSGQPLPPYVPPREGRSVAFFVAIFLGLLLLVSGALNVVLLLLSLGSFAGGLGSMEDPQRQVVVTGGDRSARDKVLRIPLVGAIAEQRSPLLGGEGGSVSTVRRALKVAAEDKEIRGVVLDVDSPGGGVTDSDEIYRLVSAFRREHPDKPVLALFGDLAASGGYYVAAAADWIVARRTSITGSIGVIMNAWNFAEAAKKLGIDQIAIKSPNTPYKDMLSPTRPMTESEQQLLTAIVEEMYQQFVDVVDEGRPGLDRNQVQSLANGAIYSAAQALQNGLVDAIGDDDTVQRWFQDRLGKKVAFLEYRRIPTLRELLFGFDSRRPASAADVAAGLLTAGTGPRFLYWWPGAR